MNQDVEKLVAAGRLSASVGEIISQMEVGAFCVHRSWGPGRIATWDLLGDSMTIDFDGKAGHAMKLEFAAKSLEVISNEHILAKRLVEKEVLEVMAKDKPTELVEMALRSYGNTMLLDDLDDILKGYVVPEARYKSWWDSTKKQMRQQTKFIVPSKRNIQMELRDEDLSQADALVSDFKRASDAKSKAKIVDSIVKEVESFASPAEDLKPVAVEVDEAISKTVRLKPAAALELIFVRDQLHEKVPELKPEGEIPSATSVIIKNRPKLAELIRALPVTAQKRLIDMMPETFGDTWVDEALDQLNQATVRTVTEIARFLRSKDKGDDLDSYLKLGLQGRTLNSEALAWICKERKTGAKSVFTADLATAIINALEKEHFEDDSKKASRLHDVVIADNELLPDLVQMSNAREVKMFARRLLATPVFEELNKRSLLARVIKIYPEIQKLVEGDDKKESQDDASLVVSWESLEARKETLTELVKVEIPKNTEDIKIAREYGDLRENSEFKMAKEYQGILRRKEQELQDDIARASGTDFKGADTEQVTIGTISDVTSTDGTKESFTILGAWDSNAEKGIVSYLSATGIALLDHKVGDEIDLQTDEGGIRKVKIEGIRAFNP
ncbi:MAG: transcription elongation GreA/GreB family factor [Verrucomicrobiales bacterium]|jgi:transcription elongation GreA/GreB family factor